jgi:hypothetical protein
MQRGLETFVPGEEQNYVEAGRDKRGAGAPKVNTLPPSPPFAMGSPLTI